MKVSIIFPTIRNDKYSEICRETIANQTLKEIEVLEYGKEYTALSGTNHGMKHAKGELITFAYDDDVLLHEKNEILYMYSQLYPDVDIFFTSYIAIDKNSKIKYLVNLQEFEIERFTTGGNYISTLSAAIRRKSVEGMTFREDYPICNEYIFWLECYRRGLKFKYIGVPLVMHRMWGDGTTTRCHEEKLKEHKRIQDEFGKEFYSKRHYTKQYTEYVKKCKMEKR